MLLKHSKHGLYEDIIGRADEADGARAEHDAGLEQPPGFLEELDRSSAATRFSKQLDRS